MRKVTGADVSYSPDGAAVYIHVYGEMLPCSVHNELVSIINENRHRRIHFTVDSPAMLLLIRESIPREYYHELGVRKAA